jgi:sodium/proline symporter
MYRARKDGDPESPVVDQRAPWISRISTVVGIAAVTTSPEFLSVLLWVGVGGIITGYGGPYLVGNFWEATSKTAAIVAFLVAFGVYFLIHHGPQAGLFEGWYPFSENPFASLPSG